jgi:hypothetical protein
MLVAEAYLQKSLISEEKGIELAFDGIFLVNKQMAYKFGRFYFWFLVSNGLWKVLPAVKVQDHDPEPAAALPLHLPDGEDRWDLHPGHCQHQQARRFPTLQIRGKTTGFSCVMFEN